MRSRPCIARVTGGKRLAYAHACVQTHSLRVQACTPQLLLAYTLCPAQSATLTLPPLLEPPNPASCAPTCATASANPPTITATAKGVSGPVEATKPAGADVTFDVSVADDFPTNVTYSCTANGQSIGGGGIGASSFSYTFSLGNTAVVCTATDCLGKTASTAPLSITVADKTAPVITVNTPPV